MRDYGKVYSSFWTSDDTRTLSCDGRLLALYLLTCPHTTMTGCFRLPDAYVCDDLEWDSERVSKGFQELFRKGFATRNESSKWVLIHGFLKWNQIENPNQAKAVMKLAEATPDSCGVKDQLLAAVSKYCRFPVKGFETVSKPETGTEAGTGTGTEDQKAPQRSRGSRLPSDWTLTDELVNAAKAIRADWTDSHIRYVADQFRDYWASQPGSKGVKLDWLATWRNWCRNDRSKPNAGPSGTEPSRANNWLCPEGTSPLELPKDDPRRIAFDNRRVVV